MFHVDSRSATRNQKHINIQLDAITASEFMDVCKSSGLKKSALARQMIRYCLDELKGQAR